MYGQTLTANLLTVLPGQAHPVLSVSQVYMHSIISHTAIVSPKAPVDVVSMDIEIPGLLWDKTSTHLYWSDSPHI